MDAVVRLANQADTARHGFASQSAGDKPILDAANPGLWGGNLAISVNHTARSRAGSQADTVFNLVTSETSPKNGLPKLTENNRNVSVDPASPRYVGRVLAQRSPWHGFTTMQGLFYQGAFAGNAPREANFVRCASETIPGPVW